MQQWRGCSSCLWPHVHWFQQVTQSHAMDPLHTFPSSGRGGVGTGALRAWRASASGTRCPPFPCTEVESWRCAGPRPTHANSTARPALLMHAGMMSRDTPPYAAPPFRSALIVYPSTAVDHGCQALHLLPSYQIATSTARSSLVHTTAGPARFVIDAPGAQALTTQVPGCHIPDLAEG